MSTSTAPSRLLATLLVVSLLVFSAPFKGGPETALAVPTDMGDITPNLRCITFVNATTGFAAGSSGVIIKTTDAGVTWSLVSSGGTGDDYDLRGISFADAQNGWAVSLTGRVLRTTNGGASWQEVSTDLGSEFYSGERIYDTHFISSSTGFAVGGVNLEAPAVYRSTLGGVGSWYQSSASPLLLGSYDPVGTNPGEVVYPRDGLGYFYGLDFVPGSTTRAWAVGQDVLRVPAKSVIWSYDANRVGFDWVQQSVTGTGKLYDVSFGTLTNGIAVGELGQIRYTTNGGTTWTAAASGLTGAIWAVDVDPTGRAWAVGASGMVIRSLNSGATWTPLPQLSGYDLEDIAWVGGNTLVAVGRGGEVIRSTNAGDSWSRPVAPALPPAPVMTTLTSSSHPAGTWAASTAVNAAWSATGTNLTGYGYVLDTTADTVPSTQNTVLTNLSTSVGGSGTYYLHVAAKDARDQWSAPFHRQLLVDVNAPGVTTDVAAGYVGSARVTITATDPHSGVNRIEHRINGGGITTTNAGQAVVDLGVGSYTLSYHAVDAVGNASAWTNVAVNVAAPAVPVMTSLTSSSHPLGSWIATTSVAAAWTATGTNIAGYGWIVDTSANTAPGTQNTVATSLGAVVAGSGTYYVHVAAKDAYNQWSAPLHRQLLVDVSAPTLVDDATTGYTGAARVTITATDQHSGVDRIEHKIDGGGTVTTNASQAAVDFGLGSFTLSYRAIDEAGNASSWTDVAVDVAAPAAPVMTSLTSSSHPLGSWVATTSIAAAWTAIGTDLTGYRWLIDSSPTSVPTIATALTSLSTVVAGSGTYYLHVAAGDAVPQWSSPWHRQLLVDVTLPTIANDATTGYVLSAHITLTASDAHSGINRVEYQIDGGGTQTAFASQAGVDLGVGEHTVRYRAIDIAGNASQWAQVGVSVAPPAAPVMTALSSSSHPLGSWVANTTIAAAWAAEGTDIAGYGWVLDSLVGTVPDTQNTIATSLSTSAGGSGTYYLHVAAIDDYDQWSTPWHRQVRIDVTAPTTSDDAVGGYASTARVTITASDAHSGVDRIEYRIDGGSVVTIAAGQAAVDIPVGSHTLTYRSVDEVGNASNWVDAPIQVDSPVAPVMTSVVSSTHPAGVWVSSTSITASWVAAGTDVTGYGWVLDDSAVTTTTVTTVKTTATGIQTTVPASGTYYLHVAAHDSNDQWSPVWHQQILVDTVKPTASDDANLTTYEGTAEVRITAADAHSGVARIEYRIDGGALQTVNDSQLLLALHSGTRTLSYRVFDFAGNATALVNRTITVVPSVTPVQGADRYTTALEACDIAFPGTLPAGPDGHRTVVIASGANWPDALAAAGLAGAHKGPLLLTTPTDLPTIVAARITSLGADRAIIVGGIAAVNDNVRAEVAVLVGGPTHVKRYSGSNRYATSNMIAAETVKVPGRTAWDGSAFVSTGANFPDALAAGPLAAAKGWPLYLAELGGISSANVDAMKAAGVVRVYILGGTGAVNDVTRARIAAAGITIAERWDGADRFATGVRVANESLERGLTVARPAVATGLKFPDALAGGVMQGLDGSVLLLTRPEALPPQVSSFVTTNSTEIEEVRFLGGTAAVSDAVRAQVLGLISP